MGSFDILGREKATGTAVNTPSQMKYSSKCKKIKKKTSGWLQASLLSFVK